MNLILDLLFPKKCVGCGNSGTYFCAECIASTSQGELVCPKCEKAAVGGQTHPVCRRKFGLDGLWSLGIYEGSLKKSIQKLKYGPLVRDFAPVLTDILIEYWARYQPFLIDEIKKDQGQGWAVVAVPLHWYKENKRGFNQSELLAKLLAQKIGLNYADALTRRRYTKSQVGLKGKQRKENIRNAFEISPDYPLPVSNYLLIDDVWTTGSTMRECCYILKRTGAKKVWAITLAR